VLTVETLLPAFDLLLVGGFVRFQNIYICTSVAYHKSPLAIEV